MKNNNSFPWLVTPLAIAISGFAAGNALASATTDTSFGVNGIATLDFNNLGTRFLVADGWLSEPVNFVYAKQPIVELGSGDIVSFASRYEEAGTAQMVQEWYTACWYDFGAGTSYCSSGGLIDRGSYGDLTEGTSKSRMSRFTAGGVPVSTVDIDGVMAVSALEQPDGKLLLMGNDLHRGSGHFFADRWGWHSPKPTMTSQIVLQRFNGDGSADSTFDGDGSLRIGLPGTRQGNGLALMPDGKIVVLSVDFNASSTNPQLWRFNSDGSLDTSFGGGDGNLQLPILNAWHLLKQQDDKLLVHYKDSNNQAYARFNSDGSIENSFAGDGTLNIGQSFVWRAPMLQQSDGKLLLSAKNVYRYDLNGIYEQTFTNPESSTDPFSLAETAAGEVLVARADYDQINYRRKVDVFYSYGSRNTTVTLDHSFYEFYHPNLSYGEILLHSNGGLIVSEAISASGSAILSRHINFAPVGGDNDSDGIVDPVDNCPLNANSDQLNADGDAQGDVCDPDDDNDGVVDIDTDADGTGNNSDFDDDGDTVLDVSDNCPLNANLNQLDTDDDLVGNVCDSDDDNDDVFDASDKFPLNAAVSTDTDNDGKPDSWNASCDVTCQANSGLALDNCPTNANTDQLNTDGDAQGNACDTDDDNDSVLDASDKFPLNAAVSTDTDNDGKPDSWNASCDVTCQTNSGLALDNCPTNANTDQLNTDGDAQGNACDTDDDNDGVLDVSDNCPLSSNANQIDTDSDSLGDVCDAAPFTATAALPDLSFKPGTGASYVVKTIAVQPDGKIIIGGGFTTVNGVARKYIARLNHDGSVDSSFNPGTGANNWVHTSTVQADGKIIIGGSFATVNGVAHNRIARLNADGSLDNSFNPGTGANDVVRSIAVQAEGKIIIGGAFTTVNGITRNRIARLNANGSLDLSFDPGIGANSSVSGIAVQDDGKILIGGGFTTVNSVARGRIARLNANGSVDLSFNPGTGANDWVNTSTVQADGKIIIGGSFATVNGVAHNCIARLNADGSLDNGFNPDKGANDDVYTIAVQADGKIIMGGHFYTAYGVEHNSVERLNADGSLDTSFKPSTGGSNWIYTIAIQVDGKIIMGGDLTYYYGTKNYIARIHSGDSDYDGIEDAADQFPNDTDNDGLTNDIDTDDDNDQMPDVWEQVNGLNLLSNDANNDADADGYTNLQEYLAATNPQDSNSHPVSVKNDYNNDGISGWYWKGDSSGNETKNEIWQLTYPLQSSGWGVPTRSYPSNFVDQPNWEIVTSGDFNKDGDADVLWRNKSTAQWRVWQIQNGTRTAQNDLADFDLAHEWQVIGAGDTDNDGDDDVILNNATTGEVRVWQMQDHAITNTYSIGTKAAYTLNRIGDFNKDGDVDLLFRQNSGDALVTWELQANAFVLERTLGNTGSGFSPACAADFDNDGDDDIMLLNSTTTQEKWIVMENYNRTQRFGSANSGFDFVACGDYDGDGDADTLWQRTSDAITRVVLQQNVLTTAAKQTVYSNPYGAVYGFVYRGNRN